MQAEITETWRDRLVEVVKMRAGDILPHPHNPKIHPPAQTEPLKGLLSEVGKCDILKAYRSERMNGALVYWDGHAREGLNKDELWNVGVYDLSDGEADLLVAGFDPVGGLSETDRDLLNALLQQVSPSNAAIRSMLAGLESSTVEARANSHKRSTPEALMLNPNEHYDYVIVLASTLQDWNVLCELLFPEGPMVEVRQGTFGYGRGIRAERLIEMLRHGNVSNSSSVS